MSGHSKWSTIKRKKAANDARRGNLFTRLAKEITLAAREGGGDPETNFGLRLAVDRAKNNNMPKDKIEAAIRRGTGEDKSGAALEQILYEGYAQNGVALVVEVVTDNRNRTVAELRHQLGEANGNLADAGSVTWQFARKAYFVFPASGADEEAVFEVAVEAGADDVLIGEEDIEVFGPVESFKDINDALEAIGVRPQEARLSMVPNAVIALEPERALSVMRVIERIEELDDVQNVYSNLEITEEAVALLDPA